MKNSFAPVQKDEPLTASLGAPGKPGFSGLKGLLSLVLFIFSLCLFAACNGPAKKSQPAAATPGDDRSFNSKRFERPPPYGSRFNND